MGCSYNCVDSFQRAGASLSTQPTGWADQRVGVWHMNIQAGQQSIGVPSLRAPLSRMVRVGYQSATRPALERRALRGQGPAVGSHCIASLAVKLRTPV
jgi:hypothetical protein